MSNDKGTVSGSVGIGFCGVLAAIFITLRILGKIDWSWVWILSPLWISLGLVAIFMCIGIIVVMKNGQ